MKKQNIAEHDILNRIDQPTTIDDILEKVRQAGIEVESLRQLLATYFRFQERELGTFSADHWAQTLIRHRELALSQNLPQIEILANNEDIQSEVSAGFTPLTILVASDDLTFVMNSLLCFLKTEGLKLHLFLYPVIEKHLLDATANPAKNERVLMIRLEASSPTAPDLEGLRRKLMQTIEEVGLINAHYQSMTARTLKVCDDIYDPKDPNYRLFSWIAQIGFAYFGFATVKKGPGGKMKLEEPLGVLSTKSKNVADWTDAIPSQVLTQLDTHEHGQIALTKSTRSFRIQRIAPLDIITIVDQNKQYVHLIIGLFTQTMYHHSLQEIPILSDKFNQVLEKYGQQENSYTWLEFSSILQRLPRDLFLMLPQLELEELALKHLSVQEHPRSQLQVWRDPFRRFFMVFLLLPEDNRIDWKQQRGIRDVFIDTFDASVIEHERHVVHKGIQLYVYNVHSPSDSEAKLPEEILADVIRNHTRSWTERLHKQLREQFAMERPNYLINKFNNAFTPDYETATPVELSCKDIAQIDDPSEDLRLYSHITKAEDGERTLHLRFCAKEKDMPSLHRLLYTLKDFGINLITETCFDVTLDEKYLIKDIEVELSQASLEAFEKMQVDLLAFIVECLEGKHESDQLNHLILTAQIMPRYVAVLRACSRFLRQVGAPFSQEGIMSCMISYPDIATDLISLFKARFDPENQNQEEAHNIQASIQQKLGGVDNLNQDRIIRRFENFIVSIVRCNFYQTDEGNTPKRWLSFKIRSADLLFIPNPKPLFEIFVYSKRFEGIHLRSGPIARGGLRWSDRPDDFRTEVLGLVKAQIVKNAVAVPSGSKGGFYVKSIESIKDPQLRQKEVEECYTDYIRALLELTDNIINKKIVPPLSVVRHDSDDPYLVVAADKGTASFSDRANSVAEELGFWLGDAFASGGSNGYDHKKMGITSRGAWESARRHFRELGVDADKDPIKVVAIGDMGGDVFGNGMLRSHSIQLIAAFNHRHIFIDPSPDTAKSYAERLRLFKVRGGWDQYDQSLLSKGGAIYERSLKSISLRPQACKALGISQSTYTPDQLIRNILTAPVDLLWNGGIGTYVRSSQETDAQVRDFTNDNLRVEGRRLRCRCVVEGGNLGFTQAARIEYASKGGMCFNDAVDNVAGVVCSDHEVNLKILLRAASEKANLDPKKINALMSRLEDSVGQLVLRYSKMQCMAISLTARSKINIFDEQIQLMEYLEKIGQLDRREMNLPDQKEVSSRKAAGALLTRPEISVLHAHAKIHLKNTLLKSDLSGEDFLNKIGQSYLPKEINQKILSVFPNHALHKEIVISYLGNYLVDCMGASFANWCQVLTNTSPLDICKAFFLSFYAFGIHELWEESLKLESDVTEQGMQDLCSNMILFLRRTMLWLLWERFDMSDLTTEIAKIKKSAQIISKGFDQTLGAVNKNEVRRIKVLLMRSKVPSELASRVADLVPLSSALDIYTCSHEQNAPLTLASGVYYAVGVSLGLQQVRNLISGLKRHTIWEHKAFWMLRQEILRQQKHIASNILKQYANTASKKKLTATAIVRRWITDNRQSHTHFSQLSKSFLKERPDFVNVAVLINELKFTFGGK